MKLQQCKLTLLAGVAPAGTFCGPGEQLLLILLLLLLGLVMVLPVLLQLDWPISAWRLAGCICMVGHSRPYWQSPGNHLEEAGFARVSNRDVEHVDRKV
jgi:hypothetical protein